MTLIMSATTAEAVSGPPAPGPSSVISRIASPWSITALNAPSTAAGERQGLAQHLDHRDRRAAARLEAELHSRRRGGREQLAASPRHELLVGRHDRAAGAQEV